uniref:Uncharacterized protein n=1 Tax=Myoviridae sp. ctOv05 TaxID=2825094 RepID=A0A8S5P519_9CAUD|nr:MAG TPA: hypothetical protein [Myoviridae sp. ctOv05]
MCGLAFLLSAVESCRIDRIKNFLKIFHKTFPV